MQRSHLYRTAAIALTGAIAGLALAACNKPAPPQNAAAAPTDGSATLTSGSTDQGAPAAQGAPTQGGGQGYATASSGGGGQGYAPGPSDGGQGPGGYSEAAYAPTPPPALPDYQQPPAPGPDYLWAPGYWGWNNSGYAWIPGACRRPPHPGLLWTPGYWRFEGGRYAFAAGYWGASVGFYGGINYGYGYGGHGYLGGRWQGEHFYYNSAVNNVVNLHVPYIYRQPVPVVTVRVAFNGPGGISARPTPGEVAVAQAAHVAPTPEQMQHSQAARANPALAARANFGHPAIAATPRSGQFTGPGVVTNARVDKPYRPPEAARPEARVAEAKPARPAEAARPAEREHHEGDERARRAEEGRPQPQ